MKHWVQLLFQRLPGPLSLTSQADLVSALTLLLSPTIQHVIEKSDDVSLKSLWTSRQSPLVVDFVGLELEREAQATDRV